MQFLILLWELSMLTGKRSAVNHARIDSPKNFPGDEIISNELIQNG